MTRWWFTRGWYWLWAIGFGIAAYAARPPYPLDAFHEDAPGVLTGVFGVAAFAMFLAACDPTWRLRLIALGAAVFATSLRVSSAALIEGVDLDVRILSITAWAMLTVATVLLTIITGSLGGRRVD